MRTSSANGNSRHFSTLPPVSFVCLVYIFFRFCCLYVARQQMHLMLEDFYRLDSVSIWQTNMPKAEKSIFLYLVCSRFVCVFF